MHQRIVNITAWRAQLSQLCTETNITVNTSEGVISKSPTLALTIKIEAPGSVEQLVDFQRLWKLVPANFVCGMPVGQY